VPALGLGPWTLGLFLASGLAAGEHAAAQTPEQMRFEVESVKLHADTASTQAGIEESPGFVRIINLPLRAVIAIAYDVMASNVAGPGWLDRRTFDITAKPPDGYTRRQLPALLRNLLVERFKLVAHQEKREGRGYALRVSAGGHRLRESAGPRTFLTGRPGLIAGNGRSMADLPPLLSQMVRAPVVDETALKGVYDIRLEWIATLAAPAAAADEPDVSLFTAVREQLGLRLEPITTTVDVVVVDSSEQTPTPD
jgi:uncharacterized protein (TIGR03435 family)